MSLLGAHIRPKAPLLRWLARGLAAPLALLGNPLTRNGYALVASAAVTSALGIVFWMLAARLYSEQQVGIGSAMISALVTLSSASQLSFGNVLNRYIPTSGARAGTLILVAYGAGLAAAVALASGFLLATRMVSPALAFIANDGWLFLWFVAAVALWTVFALQDSALAGLRQAVYVPVENAVYSVAKIVLIIAFAGLAGSGLMLFAAWTAPLLVMVAVVNLLIFGRILPARATAQAAPAFEPRQMLHFFSWDYLGGLALTASMGIAPLLVLGSAGAAGTASYYIAWTITYSLYLIGRSMGISLVAEGAADSARLPALIADTVIHTMLPLGGAALAVAIGAPLIMGLFGPFYVEHGAALLSVLALSSIPWGLVTIYLAIARATSRMAAILAVQGATLLLVLSLGSLSLPRFGAFGMGLAWLGAHTLVLMGIVGFSLWRDGRDGAIGWGIELVSAAARFAGPLRRATPAAAPDLALVLQRIQGEAAQSWTLLRALPSQSDSATFLLGPAGGEPRGVLKLATSPSGIAALERNRLQLDRLRAMPGMAIALLPSVLAFERSSDSLWLVEAMLPGEDGRRTLLDSALRTGALRAADATIDAVHAATVTGAMIDADWVGRWVDTPLRRLADIRSGVIAERQRHVALQRFGASQHAFWAGKSWPLGLGHGDFSPGNALFSWPGYPTSPPSDLAVSGLIDWDNTTTDAPSGLDLCHLLLTTRMAATRRELGPVVRELLAGAAWDEAEAAFPHLDWLADAEARRAMIGLAWLHHVTANIEKSEKYARGGIWAQINVDWVLRVYAGER